MNLSNVKIRLFKEFDRPAIKEVFREFVRFHAEQDPTCLQKSRVKNLAANMKIITIVRIPKIKSAKN